jgi:cohesin complex subunit SCC1
MFYSVFVLGKKGPLAKVWLAAHWDKKITKAQIMETNVTDSVDAILQPKVKLSLRTQSHLLLGICRIHSRKAQYLLQDCQDAAFKIKSAFRPDAVDLPDGKTEASIAAITLPEMLDFVSDFDLVTEPPVNIADQPLTAANIRSITMVEDLSSIVIDDPLMHEVRDWGDLSSVRGAAASDLSLDPSHSGAGKSKEGGLLDMYDRPIDDDGFAGTADGDVDDMFALPVPPEAQEQIQRERDEAEKQKKNDADGDRPHSRMSVDSEYSAPASMAPSGGPSTPGSVPPADAGHEDQDMDDPFAPRNADGANGTAAGGDVPLNSMVLDPIEGAAGFERKKKRRKKLGIIIDEVKTLSGEEMKSQLSDTSDIVSSLELAPPSKMLMHWKKTGGSEKLFALPERSLPSRILSKYYSRNLITSRIEREEDMEVFMTNGNATDQMPHIPDMDDLQLEQMAPPASPRKAGLRPLKPRDKLEKERSPSKKRRTHDKENQSSQPPKSPRPPRSPSRASARPSEQSVGGFRDRDESSVQNDRTGRRTLDFQQENECEDYGDAYDQPMSVGPVSVNAALHLILVY